ncbi:MAG: hypothetical protein PHX43_09195 [Alphaproteobacteria bacterium]|nr:hypothetical protein [Alphaproteobacteria bacterium]
MKNFKNLFLIAGLLSFAANAALAQKADDPSASCPDGYIAASSVDLERFQGRRLNAEELAQVQAATQNIGKDKCVPISKEPQPLDPIGIGGTVFGKAKIGCYAAHGKDGKARIMPFFEDKIREWIEADNYGTKEIVDGISVYMVCATSSEGLSVMFAVQNYKPVIYSVNWN